MIGRFDGQVALVTGGGSGIGRAIAKQFAQEGAFVYLAGRRDFKIEETTAEIASVGGECRAVLTDVTRPEDIDNLMRIIAEEHGDLHILANAAGVLRVGLLHETSEEDFDATFNANVKGLWLVSKAAIILMRGRPNANIIHISSIAGTRFDAGLGLFEASKAAVNSITKVMAKELARERIRVNAIAPGPTDTGLFHGSIFGDEVERSHYQDLVSSVPFGRMGSPEEVARLAVFLASPESDFISGSITSIDGAMGY